MKVQSISIVPALQGCNASCKYCIAEMTPCPQEMKSVNLNRLDDALLYVKAGGCQSAIITSKGETLLGIEWETLKSILQLTKDVGQIGQRDLHTNGTLILNNKEKFRKILVGGNAGITNITLTVASLDPYVNEQIMGVDIDYQELFTFLKDCGLHVRLSCVLNKEGVHDMGTLMSYINSAVAYGVDAIVLRELWMPGYDLKNQQIYDWSKDNFVDLKYIKGLIKILENNYPQTLKPIIELPWGDIAYEYEKTGLQVSTATCTVNQYKSDVFKSVVFLPDNHLYTGWESCASRIM